MSDPYPLIGEIRWPPRRTTACAFCHRRRKCTQREHVGAQVMVCDGCTLYCISSFQLYLASAMRGDKPLEDV